MATTSLRDLREERGLSLRSLAAQVGIHHPHLSEIESGRRLATPEQIATLSEFYDVSAEGWHLLLVRADA